MLQEALDLDGLGAISISTSQPGICALAQQVHKTFAFRFEILGIRSYFGENVVYARVLDGVGGAAGLSGEGARSRQGYGRICCAMNAGRGTPKVAWDS